MRQVQVSSSFSSASSAAAETNVINSSSSSNSLSSSVYQSSLALRQGLFFGLFKSLTRVLTPPRKAPAGPGASPTRKSAKAKPASVRNSATETSGGSSSSSSSNLGYTHAEVMDLGQDSDSNDSKADASVFHFAVGGWKSAPPKESEAFHVLCVQSCMKDKGRERESG